MSSTLIWILIIVGSSSVGVVTAKTLSGKYSVLFAVFIPWLVFLLFNLYSEYYGQERELMQGAWWFFQATVGTFVGMLGAGGYWVTKKLIK